MTLEYFYFVWHFAKQIVSSERCAEKSGANDNLVSNSSNRGGIKRPLRNKRQGVIKPTEATSSLDKDKKKVTTKTSEQKTTAARAIIEIRTNDTDVITKYRWNVNSFYRWFLTALYCILLVSKTKSFYYLNTKRNKQVKINVVCVLTII